MYKDHSVSFRDLKHTLSLYIHSTEVSVCPIQMLMLGYLAMTFKCLRVSISRTNMGRKNTYFKRLIYFLLTWLEEIRRIAHLGLARKEETHNQQWYIH